MKKGLFVLALMYAVAFYSGCGNTPYKSFSDVCFKVITQLQDYRGDVSKDIAAAASNIDTWPPVLQEKGKNVMAQAKTYSDLKQKGVGGRAMIESSAQLARSAGEFVDAKVKYEMGSK